LHSGRFAYNDKVDIPTGYTALKGNPVGSQSYYRLRLKTLLLTLVIVSAMLVIGVIVVSATDPFPGLPSDGRINVVHHFGGDALYCVDANGNPTDQFSDGNLGGIKLLSISGQQLWFVSAADIEAAIAIAQTTPGLGVEVFSGPGAYGPSYLYVFADLISGEIKFQFTAFDEHGKTNTMEFKFCEPVGPISGGDLDEFACPGALGSDEFCGCAVDFCLEAICCDMQQTSALACSEEDFDACMQANFGASINTCGVK